MKVKKARLIMKFYNNQFLKLILIRDNIQENSRSPVLLLIYKITIINWNKIKRSNKIEFDNNDLWKIFEYYSCIKLSEEYKKPFYEYDDIEPTFKELNKMSRNDTGIDCSDLDNTIVQCKLRKNTLTWKECSTFLAVKLFLVVN
jgi:hypothetical protein